MMRIYPSVFAYLNSSPPVTEDSILQGCDRPIVSLVTEDSILQGRDRPIVSLQPETIVPTWFIPRDDGVYEIPFPYLKPADIAHHDNQLQYGFSLANSHLRITDEVLDVDTVEAEGELAEGVFTDSTTAVLIRLLVGMFTTVFRNHEVGLIQLQEKLHEVTAESANKPIVVSIEERYQLKRKLEAITSKLRHQLRRQAELMPVGKIQEMDAYCLRDFTRRPGITAAQKAGSRQELMGIQRYQDYNTAENKFLVYFCHLLHRQCVAYFSEDGRQYRQEIDTFRRAIEIFRQQPLLQGIQTKQYKFTKPNYILEQNPIYRSFYQAYLDYVRRRYEKERVWCFRHNLLADTVYICLQAAILKFQGVGADSLAKITGSLIPEQGRYITDVSGTKLKVFLQQQVFVFSLSSLTSRTQANNQRCLNVPECDGLLTVEIHQLASATLEVETKKFPIWVFWYRPTNEALAQADIYLQKFPSSRGLLFYLQVPPNNCSPTGTTEYFSENLWLCQLPTPTTDTGFSSTLGLMADLIIAIPFEM